MTVQKLDWSIGGLRCAGCAAGLEARLNAIEGVEQARVDLAGECARLQWRAPADPGQLLAAVADAGYAVRPERAELAVSGMHCGGCAARVEQLLQAAPGVQAASASLIDERACVQLLPGMVDRVALRETLAAAGFDAQWRRSGETARRVAEQQRRRADEGLSLRRRLAVAAALTVPVLLLSMAGHLLPAWAQWLASWLPERANHALQAGLSAAVLLGPGRDFFVHGWAAMRRRAPDMNALVMLGAGAAFCLSLLATVVPDALPAGPLPIYFEAAAVIVTLILFGRLLEARAKGRTGDAIRALLALQPATAAVMGEDGALIDTPVESLQAGMRVRVRPGERLVADGVVDSGTGWVDESMLSGEPMPVDKQPGDALTGGTLNGERPLTIRLEQVGSETRLAQIIELVQQAQSARLPVQDLVNRITRWFVPAVLTLAALTLVAWLLLGPGFSHAVLAAVSVLVIACPCAMGLATPTSIMVGTGHAARAGVFFRGGDALERLAGVRAVAFDKTGTLTEGRPTLIEAHGEDNEKVLAMVAAIERDAEHPLARALVAAADERELPKMSATEVQALPGQGVRGLVDGSELLIGQARWLREMGIDTQGFAAHAEALGERGLTPVWVARDRRAVALFGIGDALKPDAFDTIAALQRRGLAVAMISGDARRTCDAIATELGIDQVVAEVLPDGKVAAINDLQARLGPLAFVGDGLNDAPALAASGVGIALGSGTDVAIESADVVLMAGEPGAVLRAIDASRATLANIRQNLLWAFGYNVLLIPVAAGLLYPFTGWLLSPMLAAAAMAASSVFVVFNALRLRHAKLG